MARRLLRRPAMMRSLRLAALALCVAPSIASAQVVIEPAPVAASRRRRRRSTRRHRPRTTRRARRSTSRRRRRAVLRGAGCDAAARLHPRAHPLAPASCAARHHRAARAVVAPLRPPSSSSRPPRRRRSTTTPPVAPLPPIPPPVVVPPPCCYGAPPGVTAPPPRRSCSSGRGRRSPMWSSRIGLGVRGTGQVINDGWNNLGIGGEFLYRVSPHLVTELAAEYQHSTATALDRVDVPVTFGLRVHIGRPTWVVSPYFVFAGGVGYASQDLKFTHDDAIYVEGAARRRPRAAPRPAPGHHRRRAARREEARQRSRRERRRHRQRRRQAGASARRRSGRPVPPRRRRLLLKLAA